MEFNSLDVFVFTQRLMFQVFPGMITKGNDPRTSKPYDILIEISDGNICLTNSPQELIKNIPDNKKEEFNKYFQRNINKLIEKDKDIATTILNEMNTMMKSFL